MGAVGGASEGHGGGGGGGGVARKQLAFEGGWRAHGRARTREGAHAGRRAGGKARTHLLHKRRDQLLLTDELPLVCDRGAHKVERRAARLGLLRSEGIREREGL